jgi:glycosyltransferase involved in cell wall biosynthesis
MKIIFNAIGCGLGPNGGSSTIVNSANALTKLEHEVYIIDSGRNQHTWTKLLCKHLIIKDMNKIPKVDVAITTGFNTWKKTLYFPAKLKVIWLRGWETWKVPEEKIVKNLSYPLIKIVNGIGLQEKLKGYGYESYLIRPGNTLEDFIPKQKTDKKSIILGGLYHTKHPTKRSNWCIEGVKVLGQKYANLKLYMFGVDNISSPNIDVYVRQPGKHQKNKFYNKVDIWLAPSTLEGLHIVPQEAMLFETPVITTNTPLAGTKDYVIHGKTGLISKNNIKSFIDKTEILIKNKKLRNEMGKAARQEIIKLGNREKNMNKMINLFRELLK